MTGIVTLLATAWQLYTREHPVFSRSTKSAFIQALTRSVPVDLRTIGTDSDAGSSLAPTQLPIDRSWASDEQSRLHGLYVEGEIAGAFRTRPSRRKFVAPGLAAAWVIC